MPIIVQQDSTIYSLFIYINRSTCFGWYLHPSSGAHVTVSTVSGISKTVTATCRERDWTGTAVPVQSRSRHVAITVLLMPDTVDTVTWAPDDGWRYHPKHVERFIDINKLYIVESCWTIIGMYFKMYGNLYVKKINNFMIIPYCYKHNYVFCNSLLRYELVRLLVIFYIGLVNASCQRWVEQNFVGGEARWSFQHVELQLGSNPKWRTNV